MARRKNPRSSTKTKIVSPSSPNQPIAKDIVVSPSSSNQATTNHITANPTSPNKESNQNWLTIINLILTAIIGIAGIAEAIYLNNQNQQNELKVIQLQSDMQRNNSLAHLKLISSGTSLVAINLGPGTANNLKIIIAPSTITPTWVSSIHDIRDFKLKTMQPTLINSIDYTHIDTYLPLMFSDINAIRISINSLPSGESVVLSPELSQLVPTEQYNVSKAIHLYLNPPKQPISDDRTSFVVSKVISTYLEYKLEISLLYSFFDCDNCITNSTVFYPLIFSSYSGFDEDDNGPTKQNSGGLLQLFDTYSIMFEMPKGINPTLQDTPLYLRANFDYANDQVDYHNVWECTPPKCT